MLQWRVYYDDGSSFSNLDGDFKEAPPDGVLAIVERDPEVGYVVYYGKDFYYQIDDETIGMCDDLGPILRKLGVIKFGRWTGRKSWSETWERIVSDSRRDFGPKSGKLIVEHGKGNS